MSTSPEQRRIEQEQIARTLESLNTADSHQQQAGAASLGRIQAPGETAVEALLSAIDQPRTDLASVYRHGMRAGTGILFQ